MPKTFDNIPHRKLNYDQDTVTGVLTQNPGSTVLSSLAGIETNGSIGVGNEFVLAARLGIAANTPAGATNYDALFFNKNAPFKFIVTQFSVTTIDVTAGDYTAADAGNLQIFLSHGDGEVSETFTDICAFNLDENVPANGLGIVVPGHATLTMDQAQVVISTGDSLRARVTLDPDATAAGTNDGGEFYVVARCLRVH